MADAVTTDRESGVPELLRGSVITLRRKCGKPNCRCADGEPHETPALSFSEGGRTKTVTLRPDEVAAVEAALARYEAARQQLEEQALAGIRALAERRRRGTRRGRRSSIWSRPRSPASDTPSSATSPPAGCSRPAGAPSPASSKSSTTRGAAPTTPTTGWCATAPGT
jgi:hypothetical protein